MNNIQNINFPRETYVVSLYQQGKIIYNENKTAFDQGASGHWAIIAQVPKDLS